MCVRTFIECDEVESSERVSCEGKRRETYHIEQSSAFCLPTAASSRLPWPAWYRPSSAESSSSLSLLVMLSSQASACLSMEEFWRARPSSRRLQHDLLELPPVSSIH